MSVVRDPAMTDVRYSDTYWRKQRAAKELVGHAEYEEGDEVRFTMGGMEARFALFLTGHHPGLLFPEDKNTMAVIRTEHVDTLYTQGDVYHIASESGLQRGSRCVIERVLFKLPAASAYKIRKTMIKDGKEVHLSFFVALVYDAGTRPPSREVEKRTLEWCDHDVKYPFLCDTAHMRNLTLQLDAPGLNGIIERADLSRVRAAHKELSHRFKGADGESLFSPIPVEHVSLQPSPIGISTRHNSIVIKETRKRKPKKKAAKSVSR